MSKTTTLNLFLLRLISSKLKSIPFFSSPFPNFKIGFKIPTILGEDWQSPWISAYNWPYYPTVLLYGVSQHLFTFICLIYSMHLLSMSYLKGSRECIQCRVYRVLFDSILAFQEFTLLLGKIKHADRKYCQEMVQY